jgi:hypothetical protein
VFYGPTEEDKVMTKTMIPIAWVAHVVPLLLAGCAGANAQPKPLDRAAQAPLIVEEVLRYGVHQFAPKGDGAEAALCVAVREGDVLRDPGPSIMKGLNNKQAQPKSACKGARTLIAGTIEWLRDDEVRVNGGFLRATEGEAHLAYRVVRENGRWVCVGPIISADPL